MPARPKGLLLDYGGTLVEEVGVDLRAGNELMLRHAIGCGETVTIEKIMERAGKVSRDVSARRDQFQIETPWPTLIRLIYDFFGITFTKSTEELELAFWKAAITTGAMPGAREAMEKFHRRGIRMGVVSNCSYGQEVIRYELAKHSLAERLEFIMVSAEYAVRKPAPLLFETAAAKLGLEARDIWFVGDRLDTDVAGAKAAGMTAVWFCPSPEGKPHNADMVVTSWTELVSKVPSAHP
ncbi:MAG TPA: HAD family hydrolase [Verrucomicrobiae bacterium]|nr:HAD family hydrolase [Verrucomicrobiae bacterium]